MIKEFCTLEISKSLKELGFNKPCLASFESSFIFGECRNSLTFDECCKLNIFPAILWSQVLDWFFDTYGMSISVVDNLVEINPSGEIGDEMLEWQFSYKIIIKNSLTTCSIFTTRDLESFTHFETREEAREHAILQAIKIVKNE